VRVLFVLSGSVRRFGDVLDELGSRGHDVHVAVHIEPRGFEELMGRLSERHPGTTRGVAPKRTDRWAPLAEALGLGIDYLRYLSPEYADAPKLRARAKQWAPSKVVRVAGSPLVRSYAGTRALAQVMRRIERAIPDSPQILEFLRAQSPDLMLLSPLIKSTSQALQSDYVRAARSLGIRSALLVRSWDNLTNKGLIREVPDRVYVWNHDLKREAVELHGVPEDRVVATGAYPWDHWFTRKPSTSGEEFRERLGLLPERPILLYVCSSGFIAPNEPSFVERWLRALRESPDQRLRTANALIRPHPSTCDRWWDSPLREMPEVAIWPLRGPRQGINVDEGFRSGYFDSIYHSSAVVGVNTSALIHSAIVGRPVFTVLDPEHTDGQQRMPHFHYLPRDNGGPVGVARDFPQHFAHLARALSANGQPDLTGREFVRRFVRPHGVGRPALTTLVKALEDQMSVPAPLPGRDGGRRAPAAMALSPLAVLAERSLGSPGVRAP
jgi:hypothetical protein